VFNTVTDFLFHQPKFVFRNPDDHVIPFENPLVKIYFSRVGNSLTSLDRSPFGSFVLDDRASKNDLLSIIREIEDWSRAKGVTSLIIRSFPEIYQAHHSLLIKNSLLATSFAIKYYYDITQAIPVSKEKMSLNTHKKRRLRKAEALGFTFRLLSIEFLEESYRLIVESREHKDYPVTMSLADLTAMFKRFPDEYLLFGMFDKNKLIATAVSIRVNAEIMYCFYIGDDLAYRTYSPVTPLVNGIYQFCQMNNYKILDLGISTDKGVLNKGLYNFKKSFGTLDSDKLTYLKQL
jgi:hypothetical protein